MNEQTAVSGGDAIAPDGRRQRRNTTYSGDLSGSGSLTKIGTGTMVLSNNVNYAGTTIVNGGALIVTGTINGTTALEVWSGTGSITIGQTGSTSAYVNPGWITLGQLSGAAGTLTQNGGNVTPGTNNLYVGWGAVPRARTTCTAAR